MSSQSVVVVDDAHPSVIYDDRWTQVQTVSSWSNEFNRTAHRVDQIGATGSFTYTGMLSQFHDPVKAPIGHFANLGTLEFPETHGYPSITYTLDNGTPFTPDLSTHATDITAGTMFYLSDSVYLGTHTLNWTVNNASATGPRFYLDAFYIYGPELPQPEEYFNMINSFNSDIYYNGGDVYQGGFTGNWTNNAPSFIYKFTGTGICIYGTLFPDQNPPVEVEVQLDNRQKSFTLPTTPQKVLAAPIYRMERLELGQHTISVTTLSSSYWKFEYFLVQTGTLTSPDFLYSSVYGNISSYPGSENGTLIPDPQSTVAPQSVFVSYTLSDHTLVPEQTYTVSIPEITSPGPPTSIEGMPKHPNVQREVVIGAVLGSITSAILVILLIWLLRRRRGMRRASILVTMRSVNYMDSAESMIMARPFYIRKLTTKVGTKPDGATKEGGGRTSKTYNIPQSITEKNRRQEEHNSISSRIMSPPVGTGTPSTPRNVVEIEAPISAPAATPPHEVLSTRRGLEPGLEPETPQEERQGRRRVIRESDAGISLDAIADNNGDNESVVVLPPAYEHHRGSGLYDS